MGLRGSVIHAANNVAVLAENLNEKTQNTDQLLIIPYAIGFAVGTVIGLTLVFSIAWLMMKQKDEHG